MNAKRWMKSRPSTKPEHGPMMTELFRSAEARLRKQDRAKRVNAGGPLPPADAARLLHELQVHQIELEMQNDELVAGRNEMEVLLEKYADLYDFAPAGYLTLDEQGQIQEVNLSGAQLLGGDRTRLINRPLTAMVAPASREIFLAFLRRVFAGGGRQVCEVSLLRGNRTPFWADIYGVVVISANGPRKWCRLVVSDITVLKRAEEAQRRAEETEAANTKLRHEIARRKVVEATLRHNEQHQRQLLEQSRIMEEQMRNLSRQVLTAQEDERKRISRELHDIIAQTLTSINLHLATLTKEAVHNPKNLARSIARTQKLMAYSADVVRRFARELRPTALDDLGLIPALQTFLKNFTAQTGIQVRLSAFGGLEQVNEDKRTVLFRIAQEALTNIARHAKASRAELKIQKRNESICLVITDNGKGFPPERMLEAKRTKRLGLLGMRERVQMFNGDFTVQSAPGKGTTVQVQIPFADARARGGGGAGVLRRRI